MPKTILSLLLIIFLMGCNEEPGIVVGGYNSSNTSHLVELCEEKLPTFFINGPDKILSKNTIMHYDFHTQMELVSQNFLPENNTPVILITSGASCPDAVVEDVIERICSFFENTLPVEHILKDYQ